jgi:hypothetical protein
MRSGPGVAFHSIIGAERPGPVESSTDSVVPYRSSHIEIEGLESELLVRSDHGVQKSPEAILEVRRILHKHLGSVPNGTVGLATPAAGTPVMATPAPRQAYSVDPSRGRR